MKQLILFAFVLCSAMARDVSFGVKEFELPGTLTLPPGKGPFPAVVLVHGSGPNDRDETIGPNKPFLELAEGLTSRGIAVLRYDKRTKVHGAKGLRTIDDEAVDDACEAVRFLRTQPEVQGSRIYVLGHSLGGYAIPRIAAKCPDIAGAIIASGPVSPLLELVKMQITSAAPGIDPAPMVARMRGAAPESYWKDLDGYNPAKAAAGQSVPLLIIQGDRDANVPVSEFRTWESTLKDRKNVTFRLYPGLNHLYAEGEGKPELGDLMKPGHVNGKVIGDIAAWMMPQGTTAPGKALRIGIIGTDTSHVPAFTKMLNDQSSPDYIPNARVVAAFKGGSPDVESSRTRVDNFANEISTKYGVEIVPDIATLVSKVDAVFIESVDGRKHLEQARAVIAGGKPFFVDKPLAATLEDAREIARLAAAAKVPWFSSSSLRYADFLANMKAPDLTGAMVWAPGPTEEHHKLDLSWYGIHGVEMLYTLMGRGCEEVTRTSTPNADEVTCRWSGGRIGTVRLIRPYGDYGAVAFRGNKAAMSPPGAKFSYVPLVREAVEFFRTGKPPVPNEETLELFAFMDAAQRSKEAGGRPVRLK